jgi:hypothetical protein
MNNEEKADRDEKKKQTLLTSVCKMDCSWGKLRQVRLEICVNRARY